MPSASPTGDDFGRALAEASPAPLIAITSTADIVFWNRAAEEAFDCTAADVLGRSAIGTIVPEEHAEELHRLIAETRARGRASARQSIRRRRDPAPVPVDLSTRLVRDVLGHTELIIVGYKDVTSIWPTREAELVRALRESEAQYREIVENAAEGIFRSTQEGRHIFANAAMARICGYPSPEEMLRAVSDIGAQVYVDPEDRRRLIAMLRERGAVSGFECQARRRDGSAIWTSQTIREVRNEQGQLLYYEGLLQDITERKRLEAELLQAQRMEGIGRLAGGIAHDFNNLLTVITGRSLQSLAQLATKHPLHRELSIIYRTAERAAGLTRQLLAFSRKQVLEPRVVVLNELVAGLTSLLKRLIGEHIELRFAPSAKAGRVRVDPGKMEQAILNLVVNARDVMPTGGRITIATKNIDFTEKNPHPRLRPGSYVELSVADTGTGISRELQAHIFEPFFTTKPEGKGTGLGLSMVYGVVMQSGGHIEVQSAVGHGAVFVMILPRTDAPLEAVPLEASDTPPRGTETILVVEDEAEVRALTQEILQDAGYTVLSAPHGDAALVLLERHAGVIHLLLTDVIMPGVSGGVLANRIKPLRPHMKVLFMSGYTDEIVRERVLTPSLQLLEKPFTPEALAIKVRDVLDSG